MTSLSDKRPGVLILSNFCSEWGGNRSVCEDLAVKLSAAGWPVYHASGIHNRARRLGDMLNTAWRERNNYSVAQVDVFSGLGFGVAETVCLFLRRLGKPYILTLHGGLLPDFAKKWPGRVRRLLRSAAAVTTPSRYLQEKLRRYRRDLTLLPNALDLSSYQFRLRRHANPDLIWVRAFDAVYNPSLASKVVAALAPEFPDLKLIMVGPDKGEGSFGRFQETARRLGVTNRINTPGGVAKAEIPGWLDRGDIFINTTNADNTPVSILEALASGLPIVSTNVGGLPYLLTDGEDALLVPPDDTAAMAAAVRRVLLEPGLSERLSNAAHEKALLFSWDYVLPAWEELIGDVIGRATVQKAAVARRGA